VNTIISWFARNGVAANLLMALILAGGLITLPQIKREIFPEIPTEMISISVLYPGAAPEEVEEGICIRIEEEIQSLEGIQEIRSTASENMGTVIVEALDGADVRQLLDDVKSRVDAIETFPEEAEEPVIAEVMIRSQVINVAVSGDVDEMTLRRLGERVRDEILALDAVTQADLVNVRPYEISIEVSEQALRRYNLSFSQVAEAVQRSSVDLPGGSIKTEGGEILLRTKGQAYNEREFSSIVVLTRRDGARITVGDVATVVDGFAETDQYSRFDGKPAVMVQVFRVGEQDALDVAESVKAYVNEARPRYPEGVSLTLWQDESQYLVSRQETLIKNGRMGFLLVFLVLTLFLRFRLAIWVSLGIPLSFLGALFLMPTLDVSINLISLFAFIIVLGIVVDDAIVVGESIYTKVEEGESGVDAAISGAKEVAVPVIFAVLTTVAAFTPLLAVPGTTGQIMRVIPLIVIPTLLFSLVESKMILPFHLSHLKRGHSEDRPGIAGAWTRLRHRVARGLAWVIENTYRPSLEFATRWRYLTAAVFTFVLLVTVGIVASGRLEFTFFPDVESDTMVATLKLPPGTPVEAAARGALQLEKAALHLEEEFPGGGDLIRHVSTSVGSQPMTRRNSQNGGNVSDATFSAAHLAEVAVELSPSEGRDIPSPDIASRWREISGSVPGAELSFNASLFSAGSPIDIRLAGHDMDELQRVADRIKEHLGTYPGVIDITDSYEAGKREIKLKIRPGAETLGLTQSDLALQVRQGFYGAEAQRIQRGRDEVKVMVRYPERARQTLAGLETMRIRTPAGDEVPFGTVARAEMGRGYASITRTDRKRTISVLADIDETEGNANEILAAVQADFLPGLMDEHPGVTYSLEGEQQEQRETMGGLIRGFLFALIVIYALMAIPFKSYLQPLVVMGSIPFGLIGAVLGHFVMGMNLTILSMFGIVALTGVVVNDSIVLVDFINKRRREGMDVHEAVLAAGPRRFRPILLTSLTTVAGLTPMLLEKSVQAQFLIPIAVSLAFGVLFSTFIILVMVPASYLILEDLLALPARIRGRSRGEAKSGSAEEAAAARP
jgi:multidrug efflux pump subunit AcrB